MKKKIKKKKFSEIDIPFLAIIGFLPFLVFFAFMGDISNDTIVISMSIYVSAYMISCSNQGCFS